MTLDYIMTHTPALIATEHDAETIEAELKAQSPFNLQQAMLVMGDTSPDEIADKLPMMEEAGKALPGLQERFGIKATECSASELALTWHLMSALELRWCMDEME